MTLEGNSILLRIESVKRRILSPWKLLHLGHELNGDPLEHGRELPTWSMDYAQIYNPKYWAIDRVHGPRDLSNGSGLVRERLIGLVRRGVIEM
ncbi:hypothetical protein DTO164E3_7691 [Paecilomyces variotii]|nr:hypothetical protein DTO164E3_7691 [Paecilomyces variotii]KAJ9205737.1 hypothetical protein DTO032I3_2293 [Paecilomyces variotii]KAJ9226640.1 hypothetical protein DTO169C6_880 [Paecilomyces variotii]KAJ9259542.1 hypothetical protein DTO195F2_4886 [Paecilomyces variotii]KAJ9271786.1 hypothetical protein DTO212C5_2211 [Paecilomyces variotii]